jgi:hypothetical protein
MPSPAGMGTISTPSPRRRDQAGDILRGPRMTGLPPSMIARPRSARRARGAVVYVFDLDDDSTHPCTVGEERVDPDEVLGIVPSARFRTGMGRPSRPSTDGGVTASRPVEPPEDPSLADLPPRRSSVGAPGSVGEVLSPGRHPRVRRSMAARRDVQRVGGGNGGRISRGVDARLRVRHVPGCAARGNYVDRLGLGQSFSRLDPLQ